MGATIQKNASDNDIMADVQRAHQNATAKGGIWKDVADQRIGPVLVLHNGMQVQLVAARAEAAPLTAQVQARSREAASTLGKVSDDLWNLVGRPGAGSDPALAILFPGGISQYVDCDAASRPDRMDILAQLLVSGVHPKVPADRAQAAAAEVTASASILRAAVDAARVPEARVTMLGRVVGAVAASAALELASLKRLYKAERFSEAEIHTVIPDRRRIRRPAKGVKAAKAAPAEAPAPAQVTPPAPAQVTQPDAPAVSTPA